MKYLLLSALAWTMAGSAVADAPASIPTPMRGHWTVVKNLSERELGCFDSLHTRQLIGLQVSLGERQLRWDGLASMQLGPNVLELSSNAFQARYGKTPQELGLAPGSVVIVDVHPSEGIPVNALVAIDKSTILIDACNIWLRAVRDEATPSAGD